jgi:filamentous hemagglutinin family protein
MQQTQRLSDKIDAKYPSLRKKPAYHRMFWGALELLATLLVSLVASGNKAIAQITLDATLGGEGSTVQPNLIINGVPSNQIGGGAIRGTNLFHSFLEFNVETGRGAYFTNPAGIENIFSRVTGSTPSKIFGTLGVLGNANLFLLNPNGIIFGPSASLDVKGSLLATTANSINWADGTTFSTTNPQVPSLLTVSVPVGLGFGNTPKEILVQGASLQVSPNKTLALVGGNLTLQGGNLTAPEGRIELGSVADLGAVNLTPISKGWALGYSGVNNFRDIQLSQSASVDTSGEGGGAIQVQGRNVTLTDGARVVSYTLGSQPGEGIHVNASKSVQLIGSGTYVQDIVPFTFGLFNPSDLRNGFFTLSSGSGNAGNITINTPEITASNGAFIASYTFGQGRAGDLTLNTSDAVKLTNSALLTVAGVEGSKDADAGNVAINTRRLTMDDNAVAITLTFGKGDGGDVTVLASDSIDLISSTPLVFDGGITLQTAIATNTAGEGNAGNAWLSTKRLTLQNGAVIEAATGAGGQGGNLTVNASESVKLTGSALNGTIPSSFGVYAYVGAMGNAGNLTVTTGKLKIEDGAALLVNSFGNSSGAAGDLTVSANSIYLNNGTITAAAAESEGGNITLQTQSLIMRNQSQITASADTGSKGGNITINAGVIGAVPTENSDITANAPQGAGGRVIINSQGIFGTQVRPNLTPESDITAFGKAAELNGTVQVNTPEINVQGALNQLNGNFITPEQAIASSCFARRNVEQGSFTVTGTGGLPTTPYDALRGRYAVTQVQALPNSARQQTSSPTPNPPSPPAQSWKLGDPIQEAQGMSVTPDGRIIVGTNPQLAAIADPQTLICHPTEVQQ